MQIIIAGFLSGVIGAMGMGGGGVLLIYLTVFAGIGQLEAQGINLLFFLPTGLLAVVMYAAAKRINWRTVFKMWIGGAVGAALGYTAARFIGTDSLQKLFACFLIVFGICQMFSGGERDAKKEPGARPGAAVPASARRD